MLEYLRKASDKPLAKILMGILIFSFVGWGVASWIFGQTAMDNSILRVGSTSLKIQTFEQEKNRMLAGMPREQQKQIYADKASQKAFAEQILAKLTSQMMLSNRAEDLGFFVSNAEVARQIKQEPAFQTNGKFDEGRMAAVLYSNQITEDGLAESVRSQRLREMVLNGVLSGISVPGFSGAAVFDAKNTTREIDFATVNFADFKAAANPSDAQLRDTYAKNPKIIPEFRHISYALVSAQMDHPDSYDAGYKTMQSLEDALISGTAMKNAAAAANAKFVVLPAIDAAGKTADGAPLTDSIFNPSLTAAAFAAEQGIESSITETKSGFVIFRVDEIAAEHKAPFDSVKKEIVAQWQNDQLRNQAYARANELLIKLNAGGELAGKKSATVGRADGAPLAVLTAAFANPVGSKTLVQGKDAFYVLNVRKAIMPTADVKKKEAAMKEAGNMLTRAMVEDYQAFLNRQYPVKINDKVYKRMF